MSQILTNLVSNAVKFTNKGTVSVVFDWQACTAPEGFLYVEIRDTGIGMTESQLSKLFQPFTQADGSTTRKYGGTGLGLSISKRLVELMGGEIGVRSSPGEGSTFHFSVLLEPAVGAEAKRMILPSGLDGLRILVVDDNAAARDVMLRQLESFGLRVDAVASGDEAVAAVATAGRSDPYRVAFIDWCMPGLDGINTVQAIRADQTLSALPKFVLVSAFGRDDIRVRAEQNGIELFVSKPVTLSALKDTLVTLFPPAEGEIACKVVGSVHPIPVELKQLRVLLAEDNVINPQIAVELLESAGALVDVAANGREAIDKLEQGNVFDVVLMDLQMPVMGGIEATCQIRAEPRFADLPIVAMTALAMATERQRCFDAGMNDHVTKPIDPDELFRVLARYGAMRRAALPVAAPTAVSEPLLEVPGLDAAAGLRRSAGKPDLYRKLLRQFVASQDDAVRDIKLARAASDFRLAARLAHTLKGVAGNIGAMPVAELAADLDNAIRENPTGKKVKALASRLDLALDQLCAAISAALGTTEAPSDYCPQEPADQVISVLIKGLRQFDGEVVDYFNNHTDVLRQSLPPGDFSALETAIRNYNFVTALARLEPASIECLATEKG